MQREMRNVPLYLSILLLSLMIGVLTLGEVQASQLSDTEISNSRLANDVSYYKLIRFLKVSGAVYPSFSPDGRKILFISRVSGEPQMWIRDLKGIDTYQVTFFKDGIAYGVWLPNGWIAMAKDIDGNERDQIILLSPDLKRLVNLTDEPDVIHVLGTYSLDGKYLAFSSNARDKRYFDVYLFDFDTWNIKRVMEANSYLVPVEFSPDSKYLIVKEYLSSFESELYLLNLRTGKVLKLNLPQDRVYKCITWPKGKQGFFLITDLDAEYTYIAFYSIEDKGLRKVIVRDYNAEQLVSTRDGKYLLISYNLDGYSKLFIYDLESDELRQIRLPRGVIYSLEPAPDNVHVAVNISTSRYPASIYLLNLKTGKLRMVIAPNTCGISPDELVEPQLVYYRSFDDTPIPGFLYVPETCLNSKCPAVISFHGGPEGQARPWFSTLTQLLVSEGYVVFKPNIRGSSGYSRAYMQADNQRNRWVSLKDGYYANLFLRSLDYVDPDRIYALGGSYGGYMTLAMLTFFPDAWAGGVDVVGISDLISFLRNTGPWRRELRMREYGHPDRDKLFLMQVSPVYHVEQVKAPLLIVHGANDPRVPEEQALNMYQALREYRKPVKLLLFEDEGHGIRKFKNRLRYYQELLKFLREGIKEVDSRDREESIGGESSASGKTTETLRSK